MSWTRAGWFTEALFDSDGRPLAAGTTVTLRTLNGQNAALYVDAAKTGPAVNPVLVAADRNVSLYADPGTYQLITGDEPPRRVVVHPDPDELDERLG